MVSRVMVFFTFGIRRPANIHDMDQGIRMAKIVKELVSETFSLVGTRDEASNIQQLNRYRSLPVHTRPMVGLAPFGNSKTGTRTRDL